jgi:glycosyltransferase involved in cell wall biosynthesis
MRTSLIVPAHNEEQTLAGCLASAVQALRAAGGESEFIVVDDASTDRTADIGREYGARVVSIDRRQIAASRNAGAAVAHGARFIFLDGDTQLPAETLAAAHRAMDRGIVGGGGHLRFDGPIPLYARMLLGTSMRTFSWLRWFPGCFVYCTREAFASVGGFDETLFASEEIAFARALKRVGPTLTLPEHTITSARKLRQNTGRQMLAMGLKIAFGGRTALQSREKLELWYGPRRPDAHLQADAESS